MKVTQNPAPQTRATETSKQGESQIAKGRDASSKNAPVSGTRDGATVEISDEARLLRSATDMVKASPEVRRDRVEALKQSIKEGTYHVSSEAIADKLVDEHLSSNFGKNDF